MKAMILSAGLGTRLGGLTSDTPKGMLLIDGYPILAWVVANLVRQGISDLVMNLHYFPEAIVDHFGDGSRYGARIDYSRETELQGTAGGLRDARAMLAGSPEILVHYGDIVTDQDFGAMLDSHRRADALATVLLHERASSNSIVAMDADQRIVGFLERPSEEERKGHASRWVNSGVCICAEEIFGCIPESGLADLPRDVFVKQVESKRMYGFPLGGFRCAIDSPERLEATRAAVAGGELAFHPSQVDREGAG